METKIVKIFATISFVALATFFASVAIVLGDESGASLVATATFVGLAIAINTQNKKEE